MKNGINQMDYLTELRWVMASLLLLISAVSDMKTHRIRMGTVLIGGIASVLVFVWEWIGEGHINWGAWLLGLGVIGVSFLTNQTIGMGDGILILETGLLIGTDAIAMSCLIALGISGFYALFLLCICKKNKKYEIPFVPFLLAGVWIVRCMEIV